MLWQIQYYTQGISFEIKMRPTVYSVTEAVKEVQATMAFKELDLTEEDIRMLQEYRRGTVSGDELRQKILSEVD